MREQNKQFSLFQNQKQKHMKFSQGFNATPTSHKKNLFSRYLFMFLLVIFLNVQSVDADCSIIGIQDIFIDSNNYCKMDFCSFASVSACYRYSCQNGTQSCTKQFQSTSDAFCYSSCCKNINAPQNANNSLSQKYCSTSQQSSNSSANTYNIVTIVIFTIFGAIVVLFLIIICCRRHEARRREAQDLHNNRSNPRGTIQTLIAPPINLNDYKLDQEGPYLINIYNQCAICLEQNVNLRTHCNHYYHGNCLYQWFKKNPANPCPLCMSKNFNPVKLYCKKCFAGDKLIVFNGGMRRTQIDAIDDHKCDLCKNNSKDDNLTFYDGSEYNGSKNGQKSMTKKNQSQTIRKDKKNNNQEVIVDDELSRSNKKMNPDQI